MPPHERRVHSFKDWQNAAGNLSHGSMNGPEIVGISKRRGKHEPEQKTAIRHAIPRGIAATTTPHRKPVSIPCQCLLTVNTRILIERDYGLKRGTEKFDGCSIAGREGWYKGYFGHLQIVELCNDSH